MGSVSQVSLGEVSMKRTDIEMGKYTAEYSEMIGSTPGIWALISASISSDATRRSWLSIMYKYEARKLTFL